MDFRKTSDLSVNGFSWQRVRSKHDSLSTVLSVNGFAVNVFGKPPFERAKITQQIKEKRKESRKANDEEKTQKEYQTEKK